MRFRHTVMTDETPDEFTRLLALRMLVELGAGNEFLRSDGFNDLAVARTFGLWDPAKPGQQYDRAAAWTELHRLLQEAERAWQAHTARTALDRNLARLAQALGMDRVDRAVVKFVSKLKTEPLLDAVADWLGRISTARATRVVAGALHLPQRAVARSLASGGVLARTQIVVLERGMSAGLDSKLETINREFPELLATADTDPVGLLRGVVTVAPPPTLRLSDYAYLREPVRVLRAYLADALATRRTGVNFFLYGAPGTGKTQLARLLAHDAGCRLLEVASEDRDGDPIGAAHRLRALAAIQALAEKQHGLVLFDEVEDVFGTPGTGPWRHSVAENCKGWINRQLEGAAVPSFWISNSVDGVDPAFVRRFDIVLEVTAPPRRQREQLFRHICQGVVGSDCIVQMANSDSLTPGIVDRAVHVARVVDGHRPRGRRARTVRWLVNATLHAQGRTGLCAPADVMDTPYDLAFLNPDSDVAALVRGLRRDARARICLFGPPGTGKTAFGRWLAEQLAVPLHVERASDLLSPYVGLTERNLARAFAAAADDGALLLIDEVDSFLRARAGARHGWEATQVNEMLTQMETFPGLLVATTNRLGDVDDAALRRFDAKIRFDYLQPDQAVALFRRACSAVGLGEPAECDEIAIARATNVTPGDIATLIRQHRFRQVPSAAELARLLLHECALKESAPHSVGFLA